MKNKKGFLKIPNAILKYKLSPVALKVYIYLSGTFFSYNEVVIKYETIADKCGMSIGTVKKAVSELETKQLLSKVIRVGAHNQRMANAYIITRLNGRFTMIKRDVLKPQKDYSVFAVYCSLAIRKNKAGRAFPSIAQIVQDTGLCKTTVIDKLRILREQGFIIRTHYICAAGDFGHNNYDVFSAPVHKQVLSLMIIAAAQTAEVLNASVVLLCSKTQGAVVLTVKRALCRLYQWGRRSLSPNSPNGGREAEWNTS